MATILCVDDEPSVGVILEHTLTKIGHRPLLVSSVEEAMQAVTRTPLDLIIADYRMPRLTGLDLLGLLEKEGYRIPVIIMTGYSSIEHAVISIKTGAIDYLTKPIRAETLEIAVQQALEVVRLRRENETFRHEILKIRSTRALIGESESFRRIMEVITTVAPTRATVLLQGESGTGKELFARALHDQSPRQDAPFITMNCAALPEGLVESALFGHEKGAFTGATVRTAGAFERAHGGTLLLDEISEMRLDLQAKLLRVIQEQEFERVGGTQAIKVDVRLVATTNRDLKAEVDAGRFRSDLYYRLNVVPIRTPPLRERVEDIPRLLHHFMHRMAENLGRRTPASRRKPCSSCSAMPGRKCAGAGQRDRAGRHPLPGQHAAPQRLRRPVRGCGGAGGAAGPRPERRPGRGTGRPGGAPFDLDEIERRAIVRALEATGGNRTRAAKLLGISERTLRNKLNSPGTNAATGT